MKHTWMITGVLAVSLLQTAAVAFGTGSSSTNGTRAQAFPFVFTMDSYGIYREVQDDREVELVKSTASVEARNKTLFGFRYTLSGFPPGTPVTLRMVLKHPPFRKPDGALDRGYDRGISTEARPDGAVAGFRGFAFDHDYEIAPGKWIFEIWYGGRRVFGDTFNVTRAK